jgi:hypothetical protein
MFSRSCSSAATLAHALQRFYRNITHWKGHTMSSTRDRTPHETVSGDKQALAATHERVLRVLGLSRRPLQSGELQNALGLVPNETTRVCEWLTDRGYISAVQRGRAAQQAMKQWALADKGRSWAKGQGALVPENA